MADIETVVIGAGVVGLAVARELAIAGQEVIVLERNDCIGSETSARNSEVIHAGIYYPQGSLKARTCVRGRDILYAYCVEHGVAHKRLGKLIVATDDQQVDELETIKSRAHANGVTDLVRLHAAEARSLEPALDCQAALLSPSTGIVDSHGLMLSLLGEMETRGAFLALSTPVISAEKVDDGIALECGGVEPYTLVTRNLVNACGLSAPAFARAMWPDAPQPPIQFARGNYFSLSGISAPFQRLIYPVPEPGGLGVHLTLDMGGRGRFGPDVEWTDNELYDVNATRSAGFYGAIRKYWPQLPDGALMPDYVGIRPKLAKTTDFVIAGPEAHGMRGVVHLLGVESPGLTASLALAEIVAERLSL